MKVLAVCCLLLEIQTKEGTELFLAYFKDLHGWTNGSVLIDSHPFWENENAASSFSKWSGFISTDHCLGGVVGSDRKSYSQLISVGVLLFLRFVSSILIDE